MARWFLITTFRSLSTGADRWLSSARHTHWVAAGQVEGLVVVHVAGDAYHNRGGCVAHGLAASVLDGGAGPVPSKE